MSVQYSHEVRPATSASEVGGPSGHITPQKPTRSRSGKLNWTRTLILAHRHTQGCQQRSISHISSSSGDSTTSCKSKACDKTWNSSNTLRHLAANSIQEMPPRLFPSCANCNLAQPSVHSETLSSAVAAPWRAKKKTNSQHPGCNGRSAGLGAKDRTEKDVIKESTNGFAGRGAPKRSESRRYGLFVPRLRQADQDVRMRPTRDPMSTERLKSPSMETSSRIRSELGARTGSTCKQTA